MCHLSFITVFLHNPRGELTLIARARFGKAAEMTIQWMNGYSNN